MDKITTRTIYDSSLQKSAKFADVIHAREWCWLAPRRERLLIFKLLYVESCSQILMLQIKFFSWDLKMGNSLILRLGI